MWRKWYVVCSLCAGIFICGCLLNKTRENTTITQTAVQSRSTMNDEEQSPSSIYYTFLDTINRGNELNLNEDDFGKNVQQSVSDGAQVNSVGETRYRIQVLALNKIESIREQKIELEKKITEPIVIGYEAPYYKLFAGSYQKRQEAQMLLQKLRKLGFLDAWIVSNSVNLEK